MQSPAHNKRSYHHGDLRRALVAIAVRRIRRVGAARFSLREAAREAGVTAGAVYRHFPDKGSLLAAVAERGFLLLSRRMEEATEGLTAADRLLAAGHAYIAFASAEPKLFRLMFSAAGLNARPAKGGRAEAALGTFNQLRGAVADLEGISPDAVDEGLLGLTWAAAHGAASLISDGVWGRDDPRAKAALANFVTLLTAASQRAAPPTQSQVGGP